LALLKLTNRRPDLRDCRYDFTEDLLAWLVTGPGREGLESLDWRWHATSGWLEELRRDMGGGHCACPES
jgi:hypothetical protein